MAEKQSKRIAGGGLKMTHGGFSAAFLGVALLTGCAQSPDGTTPNIFSDLRTVLPSSSGSLSPAQQQLRSQERAYANSRLLAAGGGAVLGAGACWAADRSAAEIAACALGGGAAGYAGSTYLTRNHQNFAVSQESLQQDIAAAREDGAQMARNVQVAQGALAAQQAEIRRLNDAYRSGQTSQAEYEARLRTVGDDVRSVRNMRQQAQTRVSNLQQSKRAYDSAGLGSASLNSELQAQQAHLASLQRIENGMLSVIQTAPANVRRPSV